MQLEFNQQYEILHVLGLCPVLDRQLATPSDKGSIYVEVEKPTTRIHGFSDHFAYINGFRHARAVQGEPGIRQSTSSDLF